MSLMISIGRNVGTVPMSDDRWSQFMVATGRACADTVGAVNAVHVGSATWQGVEEVSAILTVYAPDLSEHDALARSLAALADEYGQEAIALTLGHSEMVTAESIAARLAVLA